jgi:MoxR-like ATPase
MPQIRVLIGYQQGQVFALDQNGVVIGRDTQSDIVLHQDSPASRKHAEIFCSEGRWRVRDLGSVNGTALNGRKVAEEDLKNQDEVVIGENVFVFEEKEPDAARIAEAASHANLVDSRGIQNRPEVQALIHSMPKRADALVQALGRSVPIEPHIIRATFTAVIASGHLLLASGARPMAPIYLRTLSEAFGLHFVRIPFTRHLSPTIITGTEVLAMNEETGQQEYLFKRGPIFSQLVLADALNEATAETQACVFRAMNDYLVTAAGQSWHVDAPFIVAATQSDSAAPLADDVVERFMFSFPLDRLPGDPSQIGAEPVEPMFNVKQIVALQECVRDMCVSDYLVRYAVRMVRATRPADSIAPDLVRNFVYSGAGPRAAHHLILAAKARALMYGRVLVNAADIRCVALPVLRHRLLMNHAAAREGITPDQIVQMLVRHVPESSDETE